MQQSTFSRRQFLQMSALAGGAAALAACSAVSAPSGSGEAGVPTGEMTTVTVWGWWEERMKFFQLAGDGYHDQHPETEVVVETLSGDELWTKIFASVPAGTGPTLCKMVTSNYFKLRDQDLLVPLADDIFTGISLREKYPNHGWDQYGFYCVPEGGQPAVFTYNKRLFEEAGLDPDAPPKSWEEMVAAAEAVTVRDANGAITVAGFHPDSWLFALNPLYQLGGMIVSRAGDTLTATFDTPEMAQAYQFYLDLAQKYNVWDPNLPYVSDAIGNVQAAMSIGEAWVHGVYKTDFPETYADLGFSAPPTPTGEAAPYFGRKNAVLSLALLKNRPQEESDAGFDFLEYLVVDRTDLQFELANISGLVPAHVDLINSDKVESDDFLALGKSILPQEYDTVEISSALSQLISDVLNKVLLENSSLDAALAFGQEELQKMIDGDELKHIY